MFFQTTRWNSPQGGFFDFLLSLFAPDAGGTMDPNGHY
jgi:hypothetical protein